MLASHPMASIMCKAQTDGLRLHVAPRSPRHPLRVRRVSATGISFAVLHKCCSTQLPIECTPLQPWHVRAKHIARSTSTRYECLCCWRCFVSASSSSLVYPVSSCAETTAKASPKAARQDARQKAMAGMRMAEVLGTSRADEATQ